jgi:hypothetical protein
MPMPLAQGAWRDVEDSAGDRLEIGNSRSDAMRSVPPANAGYPYPRKNIGKIAEKIDLYRTACEDMP